MARKQVQAFTISFLDLLSGALGAVILLFIIVPKLDSETQEELEALNRVNIEIEELQDILEQAKNSIPKEIYEEIQSQIDSLEDAVAILTEEMEDLREALAEANSQIENLESQVQQQEQQIESMNQQIQEQAEEISDLRDQVAQLERQIRECERVTERLKAEGHYLVVTMSWETHGDDVDLHVIDPTGAEFYYRQPIHAGRPGKLTKDDVDGPGVEVWQTNSLSVGTYQIKANLYDWESGIPPDLVFWVYYRNGNRSFRSRLNRESEKKLITRLTVNSNRVITF